MSFTTVIWVDDSRRLLSAWDMRAVTYPSAEAFIGDVHRPPFDCLILDIQLGGMSGFDIQEQLRKTDSPVPVVFITAHDAAETRERALDTGVAYIPKAEPGVVLREAILRAARRPE